MPRDQLLRHFAPQVRALLQQRLAFGAYPEVVLTPDPASLLRELSADYLWKDVLQIGLIAPALAARPPGRLRGIGERAGNPAGDGATDGRALPGPAGTDLIFRLPSFGTNPRKEIAKGRKVFFWDTGIRNALLNAFATEVLRPDIGPLWENWTIAEIAKHNALLGVPAELFFWRSRTWSEVDLVIKQGDRLRAFEIKW